MQANNEQKGRREHSERRSEREGGQGLNPTLLSAREKHFEFYVALESH